MRTLSIARHPKRWLLCVHHLQQSWRMLICRKLVTDCGWLITPMAHGTQIRRCMSDLTTENNVRQWHGCHSHSRQRNYCLPVWGASSASVSNSKMFLNHQLMPNCLHPRRYVSTEPTTVYEIILASKPVQLSQSLLEYSHDLMGLPWWASLIISTFTLRAVLTFPLGIYTQYIKAKVERLQPEIVMMAKQAFVRKFAERAILEGWSEKRAERTVMRLVKQYSKEVFIRDNCHPAKGSILLLVQLPLWVCLSLALRNMTGAFAETVYLDPANIVPALSTEGALWFADLTMADPFIILPVLVGFLNLCNIEIMALHKNPVSRTQRYVTNLLRSLSLVMIPIAAYVPTAMALYWASSAFYGLVQNILLKSPTARSVLNIPSAPSDSKTPFRDIGDIIQTRYLGRKVESEEGKGEGEAKDIGDRRSEDGRRQEMRRAGKKGKS